MKSFERIAVLIEESRTGRNLLIYVRELARLCETREIELLHIVPYEPSVSLVAVPVAGSGIWVNQESVRRRDAQRAAKAEELELLAREVLPNGAGYTVRTTVLFGSPLYETLENTLNRGTDLLVVGRHFAGDGHPDERATMARRLTRKSACSVLVVPENDFAFPTRLLVPVRDSECSAQALEVACALAAPTDGLVFAFNLYSTSSAGMRRGLPGQEPNDFPETRANEEIAALRERVDTRGVYVEYLCHPDPDDRPEEKMLEAVEKTCAHAVVIGARGRTGTAGVLLGKVTEKLIAHAGVPVFAVKKKGEMIGVLKAILELARK